ncbi:acyltransferase family protein [Flexivirga meconopsidis]|uniref:acyltransferase family protein n=1 Tax=Flexivirga meconopsidis TaxID=2977121 RepID=UPI00224055F7|nr:acyltransferase family protein [Flexivirga meconopsidis]
MSAPVAPAPLPTRRDWQAARSRAKKNRTRTDIQALRALSVLLVVGYHLWPGAISGGFIGVDVFFVISGFLITDHLLREAGKNGRISLAQFWTRRAFRLLPASLLVIVLTALATFVWVGEDQWRTYFQQAIASGFYVQNWKLAASATDYLSATDPPTAYQHFWSLSVEEQFYIVLPLLLVATLLGTRRRRIWRRWFLLVVATVTLASFVWSVYLTVADPAAAYFVTTTRAWEFGIGALLAFAGTQRFAKVPPAVAWVGGAMLLIAAFRFTGGTPFPGYAALLPTVGGALMIATIRHDRVFNIIADNHVVQLIGNASYSIYLWHWPIVVLAPIALGHSLGFVGRLVILVISLFLGHLSMQFVERPLRAHGNARWFTRSGLAVVAGAVAVLLVGNAGLNLLGQREAAAKQAVTKARTTTDPCVGAPALNRSTCEQPSKLTPSLALLRSDDGTNDKCWSERAETVIRRCTLAAPDKPKKRVYAVGDSHLGALHPALTTAGKELDWRIESAAHEGCYLAEGEMPIDDPVRRASCKTWRADLLDQIVADETIDTVLVTRYDVNLVRGDDKAATVKGLQDAWRRIVDSGKQVIVVQDVPRADQSVLDCVSQNGIDATTKCVVPQDEAFPSWQALREAAKGMKGVTFVPVAQTFCKDGGCPSVIGGVPVFRNVGHLSKTFSTTWGPELADQLRKATQS